jgi:hypothetical protein
MPRMHILTASEQKAFDTPPVFSDAERDAFFHVSESLAALLATLRSPINRVGLVLTVGYFRATKRFFAPPFHQTDVAYVAKKLGYVPAQTRHHASSTCSFPQAFKAPRGRAGIARGMFGVPVPEIILNQAQIIASVGQGIATAMA